jgi:hypothetical protein
MTDSRIAPTDGRCEDPRDLGRYAAAHAPGGSMRIEDYALPDGEGQFLACSLRLAAEG